MYTPHSFGYKFRNVALNGYVLFLLALPVVMFLPAIELWGIDFYTELDVVRINTIIANMLAFFSTSFILGQFKKFAGINVISHILPTISIIYLAIFSYFLFTRMGYSRHVLLTGFLLQLSWFFIIHFFMQRYKKFVFAVAPFGNIQALIQPTQNKWVSFIVLDTPVIPNQKINGIIADLDSEQLTQQWIRFLTDCTLSYIPVFNIKQIQETLTGRIEVKHLSENQLGTLLPSPFYCAIKRLFDILIILATLPITFSIMIITAIIIRIESSDSIFFTQDRVGQRNKNFKIYKFRSMCSDAEKHGAKFATQNDQRITRVGKFIRKTRIDELPQILNVLKGDMSLIGPRPEQRIFVDQFEHEIPFYLYRLVVKPGMTGWAQVMHGYASDQDQTMQKIQYDFYYIKHFSFWLDILICLKTIHVLFTGYGAK